MREDTYPLPVTDVVATVAEILRRQGQKELADLLAGAHARLDVVGYDNWDGGTYDWALRLEVPVEVLAAIEPRLAKIEGVLVRKLTHFDRLYPNDHLRTVTITPMPPGKQAVGLPMAPSQDEMCALWPDSRFRLFLSHVAAHKADATKIKMELALRGVEAFVAHKDIKPSLEWQKQIEIALRSMHALAALITPDFHASLWTDQEIGWALGRELPVIPICLGADPYGLAGKYQGVPATSGQPKAVADAIVGALLKHPHTDGEMRRALVAAFVEATSYPMAQALCKFVVRIDAPTDQEKQLVLSACDENPQVAKAYNVPEAINRAFGASAPPMAPEEDAPF